VNEWLKFGEAKNGVLVTLNGAAIVAIHNMAKLYGPFEWVGALWLWWATACCLASLAIGLASFYARTNIKAFSFARDTPQGSNTIYFGHLAEMNQGDLLKRLVGPYDCRKTTATSRTWPDRSSPTLSSRPKS
jgi:hypothetical protein